MRECLRAVVVAMAISAVACAQPNALDSTATDLPIERLVFEQNSGFEEADQRVIRNAIEWPFVWTRINGSRSPMPPLPVIDFSKEQIIVAALGERPSGGYSVVITGASRTGDVVTVRLESRSPGSRCVVTASITHPVDVVKMPRTVGSVVFEETAVVKNCG